MFPLSKRVEGGWWPSGKSAWLQIQGSPFRSPVSPKSFHAIHQKDMFARKMT